MIFGYDELKGYITEDFERFYRMGFHEEQVLPAVMDEYEHGEDFCEVEKICIHLFLALNYAEKKWNYDEIAEKFTILWKDKIVNEVKTELGNEYIKFHTDFQRLFSG